MAGQLAFREPHRLGLHRGEQRRLVGVVRRGGVEGGRTELVNAFRRQHAAPIPGHEHDQGVAAGRLEPTVGHGLAIDGAIGVRTAVDGQIHLTADNPVDLAPGGIDAPEVGFEAGDRLDERGPHVRHVVGFQRFGERNGGHYRKGGAAAIDTGAPVPSAQHALRLGDIGVAFGIERQNRADHLGHVRAGAVGNVELVGAEGLRADVRIGAEGLQGAPGPVGHIGLDTHRRGEIDRLERIGGASRRERGVVGVEHEAGRRVPDLRRPIKRQIAMPDQVGTVARQDPGPVDARPSIREEAVVNIADISPLVGVDIVDAG